MEVLIEQIRPIPYQVRLSFKTKDLKEEIQKDGLLSPLIVRRQNGYYELVDGQRRLETVKELGWQKVPVEIQDVDDKKARLMVYKLNAIRESYTTEEKARYFKKLNEEGMTFYQIGKELNVDDQWVLAHINVFKFPEDIQNAVWTGELSISHVQRLEPIIGANLEDATKIAREILLRRISVTQTEKLVQDRKETIEKARVEAAKKAIGVMTPIAEVKIETPEEFERVAETLRKEAKKRREETLTPEEKVRIEAEKRHKKEAKREREEAKRKHQAEERRHLEEDVRKKAEIELQQKLDAERKLIEKEAIEKAKDTLLEDKNLLRDASQRYKELLTEERLAKRREIEKAVEWKVTEADLVHKIIIGDARVILKEVDKPFVDLVITSPPYFDLKEYPENSSAINTNSIDHYLEDLETIFRECYNTMKDGRFLCVVVGQFTSNEESYFIPQRIAELLEKIGFKYRREHIWVKPLGVQGIWNRGTTSFLNEPYPRNTMINIHHEHILIFQKGDKPEIYYGRNPLTEEEVKEWAWSIWELPVSDIKEHPAPFPESIAERLIKMYSYEGEVVLDPFLGSGTTSKVAKTLKRRSIGIEVLPEYLPLIKREVGGAEIIRYDNNEKLDFITYLTKTSLTS